MDANEFATRDKLFRESQLHKKSIITIYTIQLVQREFANLRGHMLSLNY